MLFEAGLSDAKKTKSFKVAVVVVVVVVVVETRKPRGAPQKRKPH